jgi:hypothetical protein
VFYAKKKEKISRSYQKIGLSDSFPVMLQTEMKNKNKTTFSLENKERKLVSECLVQVAKILVPYIFSY